MKKIAQMIKASTSFSAFTGAGISTDCGIPDQRSGPETCLKIGQGTSFSNFPKPQASNKYKDVIKPSLAHMALVELINKNLLSNIISQNIDGLHIASGVHPDKLFELSGNQNIEECKTCGKRIYRDFCVRKASNAPKNHATDRQCTGEC